MASQMTKDDLVELIRIALDCADDLRELAAASRLDQALVDLVGEGQTPRVSAFA